MDITEFPILNKIHSLKQRHWSTTKIHCYSDIKIANEIGVSEILTQILIPQGINTRADIYRFLNPQKTFLVSDILISQYIKDVVSMMLCTVLNKEKILIIGNSSVDTVMATSLLVKYLTLYCNEVDFYLFSTREGLIDVCNKYIDQKYKLFTFDQMLSMPKKNIVSISRNLTEVQVKNHSHFPKSQKQYDSERISISYLIFLIITLLDKAIRNQSYYKNNTLINYLDIVAMGTLYGNVDMHGINRASVIQGINILVQKKNIGFKSLINFLAAEKKTPRENLVYQIGRKICSAVYMNQATIIVKLLTSLYEQDAIALVKRLHTIDQQCKGIENILIDQARQSCNQEDKITFLIYEEIPYIEMMNNIAKILRNMYCKPVILVVKKVTLAFMIFECIQNFGMCNFIAKAVKTKLIKRIQNANSTEQYIIKIDKLDIFQEHVKHYINTIQNWQSIHDQAATINIDICARINDINLQLYDTVTRLAPYGKGNKKPIVYLKYCIIIQIYNSSQGIIFFIRDSILTRSQNIKCILFHERGLNCIKCPVDIGSKLQIVGNLQINQKIHGQIDLIVHDISYESL